MICQNRKVTAFVCMALASCLLLVARKTIGCDSRQSTSSVVPQVAPKLAALPIAQPPPAPPAIDGMFPPAAAAKRFIDFDGRGFLVNGKRTFLTSGSLHYARVPRELWRDRLLRMKRAGFNTVQTYVFWNFHEPREGTWDFSGSRDLDAFLKLVKQMGMYATVRVGPYICAEWDSGGFPGLAALQARSQGSNR